MCLFFNNTPLIPLLRRTINKLQKYLEEMWGVQRGENIFFAKKRAFILIRSFSVAIRGNEKGLWSSELQKWLQKWYALYMDTHHLLLLIS